MGTWVWTGTEVEGGAAVALHAEIMAPTDRIRKIKK
jgi:hypothetical protein